jgi:hypothetical protein
MCKECNGTCPESKMAALGTDETGEIVKLDVEPVEGFDCHHQQSLCEIGITECPDVCDTPRDNERESAQLRRALRRALGGPAGDKPMAAALWRGSRLRRGKAVPPPALLSERRGPTAADFVADAVDDCSYIEDPARRQAYVTVTILAAAGTTSYEEAARAATAACNALTKAEKVKASFDREQETARLRAHAASFRRAGGVEGEARVVARPGGGVTIVQGEEVRAEEREKEQRELRLAAEERERREREKGQIEKFAEAYQESGRAPRVMGLPQDRIRHIHA